MRYMVTHSGDVHTDDVLCMAFFLAMYGEHKPVFRRNPTEAEMRDSDVMVMDIGGDYSPILNNYDHHQFGRSDPATCAISLFLQNKEPLVLKHIKGFGFLDVIDSKGPLTAAQVYEISRENLFAMMSPLELGLKGVIKEQTELDAPTARILASIGRVLISMAENKEENILRLSHCPIVKIGDVEVLVNHSDNVNGSEEFVAVMENEIAATISYDNRGNGWALYRFSDNPHLDFSKLEGNPKISFAHKGGFIAKTKERISEEEVLELIRLAVVV